MDSRNSWRNSLTIGIGVEGPSDRAFWQKVLEKHFRKIRFDIRSMNNRSKLIRESPKLIEQFQGLHYKSSFIILDHDDDPCIKSIVDEFDITIQNEARKPLNIRRVFICVAVRELEAWYLADEAAIQQFFQKSKYSAPSDTSILNAKRKLNDLWKGEFSSALNKIDLAKSIAPSFSPTKARLHSKSFDYFWERISGQS